MGVTYESFAIKNSISRSSASTTKISSYDASLAASFSNFVSRYLFRALARTKSLLCIGYSPCKGNKKTVDYPTPSQATKVLVSAVSHSQGRFKRHSRHVLRDKRWPALRQKALRRDDFQCVECGKRGRLEVDHIKPVRTHPELSFDLDNLQALCGSCHARKTRIECGHNPQSPERLEWLKAVRDLKNQKDL